MYPVSASGLEEVTLCFIAASFFEATLEINHTFTYSLLQFYANELRQAEKRMGNLIHVDVKGRVAETLLTAEKGIWPKCKRLFEHYLNKTGPGLLCRYYV